MTTEHVEQKAPPPGSNAARADGCTCPVIDNHYGQGRPSKNGPRFIMAEDCPLHVPAAPASPAERRQTENP